MQESKAAAKKTGPNGRPFKKDCYQFFADESNWVKVWDDPSQKLRLERLKHTMILRLVAYDQRWGCLWGDNAMNYDIAYCMKSKSGERIDDFITGRPSVAEVEETVYSSWRAEP